MSDVKVIELGDIFESLTNNITKVDNLESLFRNLCMEVGEQNLNVTPTIKKIFGIKYNEWGSDSPEKGELAECLLLDAFTILSGGKDVNGENLYFTTSVGQRMAQALGVQGCEVRSPQEAVDRYLVLLGLANPEDLVGVETEEVAPEEIPEDEEEFEEEEFEEVTGEEENVEEEPPKEEEKPQEEPPKKEEDGKEAEKIPKTEQEKEFEKYYGPSLTGALETLMSRYTDLFASGFELDKFAGVFSGTDLWSIKNGVAVPYNTAVTQKVAVYLSNSIFGKETTVPGTDLKVISNERSLNGICRDIMRVYTSTKFVNLYFPRKILEIAFGRQLTIRTDSNNYEPSKDGKSWGKYKKTLLEHTKDILYKAASLYLDYEIKRGMLKPEEKLSPKALDLLAPYVNYTIDCLSNAIICVDYNQLQGEIAALKFRFFDKNNAVDNNSFIPMLVNQVFGQSPGVDNFDDIEVTPNNVKTFSHERNHGANQAIPNFAYKAFLVLKENGIPLTMETLILGKSPKGTILRNGSGGIDLGTKVSHYVIAGSRAGKGVMTLNFLGGALASGRPVFYLDNKPDMAAMFSEIAPGMVVLNGRSLINGDIDFKQGLGYWLNIDSKLNKANIPDYALQALGLPISDSSRSWSALGDVFYFRAYELIIGFMIYCAFNVYSKQELLDEKTGKKITKWVDTVYGTNGLCLVVDEISNTLTGFMSDLENLACMQAPEKFEDTLYKLIDNNDVEKDKLERIRQKEAEGKSTAGMKKARPKDGPALKAELARIGYSEASYYASAFLDATDRSIKAIGKLANAGFNDRSSLLDVFIIGQNVERKFLSGSQASSLLTGTKYATSSSWKGTTYNKSNVENGIDFATTDIFAPMLSVGKTPDGFFGANQGVGNDYFAQKNEKSKAFGRLDTKASNFGYLDDFGEDARSKIKNNVDAASRLKYFKPFLTLNKNSVSYVSQMAKRLTEAGVPYEMVVADNPELDANGNPTGTLSRYVGFDEYLKLIDEGNVAQKTANYSGEILNNYVQNVLGYSGTWFDLVTDLRFEAIISVENIGQKVENFGSMDAPYMSRYKKFLKLLNESGINSDIEDAFEGGEDFDEADFINSGFDMSGAVDPHKDEVDVFGEGKKEVGGLTENNTSEKLEELAGKVASGEMEKEDFMSVIRSLQNTGSLKNIDMIPMPDGSMVSKEDLGIEDETSSGGYVAPPEVGVVGSPEYNENFLIGDTITGSGVLPNLDFSAGGSSESLKSVVNYITSDILGTFGGVSRITSFGVESGHIKVNDVMFKLRGLTKEQALALPYDLRYQLSSGNISGLFDYTQLLKMKNLRVLSLDSNTAYNHVRVAWNMRDIDPGDFFKKLKSLKVLKIDGKVIDEKSAGTNKGIFRDERTADRVARAQDSFTNRAFGATWGFTRNVATNKNLSVLEKAAGITIGAGLTTVAGAAIATKGLVKGVFGGLKGAVKGVSEALQEGPK